MNQSAQRAVAILKACKAEFVILSGSEAVQSESVEKIKALLCPPEEKKVTRRSDRVAFNYVENTIPKDLAVGEMVHLYNVEGHTIEDVRCRALNFATKYWGKKSCITTILRNQPSDDPFKSQSVVELIRVG